MVGRVLGRVRACGCVAMASASFEGNGEAHAVEDASTRADGVLSVCTDDLGEPGSDRSREGEERRRRNPQESNETTPPGPEEDGGANLAVPKENHGGEGDSDLQRNASTCWGEDPSEEGASNTWKRGSRPFRKTAVQKKKDTRNHGEKRRSRCKGRVVASRRRQRMERTAFDARADDGADEEAKRDAAQVRNPRNSMGSSPGKSRTSRKSANENYEATCSKSEITSGTCTRHPFQSKQRGKKEHKCDTLDESDGDPLHKTRSAESAQKERLGERTKRISSRTDPTQR